MNKALEKAGDIAKAYKVGPKEAAALVCLTQKIDKSVVDVLKDAVRKRGMRAFLTHEAISKDIFNIAWSSGTGQYEQWNDVLANRDDNELDPSWYLFNILRSANSSFVL